MLVNNLLFAPKLQRVKYPRCFLLIMLNSIYSYFLLTIFCNLIFINIKFKIFSSNILSFDNQLTVNKHLISLFLQQTSHSSTNNCYTCKVFLELTFYERLIHISHLLYYYNAVFNVNCPNYN